MYLSIIVVHLKFNVFEFKENKENKGRKLNKKSPISSATPEVLVEEIPVEGQIEDFESHILLPYPSRDDEYGIPFVVPANNEDWVGWLCSNKEQNFENFWPISDKM